MDRVSSKKSTGSFTLVMAMTTLVLVVPCLAAVLLRAADIVTSPVLLILIPVLVSVLFSHVVSEVWKRRRGGNPLLFEDLMLWGWLRKRRFERLLSRSEDFVGPGAGEGLSPEQRAKELERLIAALEARDPRTHGHSRRVARHAASIARNMKLPGEEVARIRTAALLHDVGKVTIPWEVLDKPGKLTDEEYEVIKTHSAAGADLVAGMGDPELVAIVRHHHERIDGAGYPDGLVRGQIPMGARIIAVADTFDALTSARCYRSAKSHEQALEVLRAEAGTQLDDRAVRAFDGRYSSRRPVAVAAAVLGLGRQAGQSLITFGTGASQVAAVGAAAAVIGAAPAVQVDRQDPQSEPAPAIVREAGPTGEATASTTVAGDDDGTASGEANPRGTGGKDRGRQARIQSLGGSTGTDNTSSGTDGGGSTGNGGGSGGSDTGSGGGGGTGGTGGSGGSTGGSGGSTTGSTLSDTTTAVTEAVQKPVQQVTQTVTDAIPTLPGDDPVSKGVNETVGGVKDTLGKIVGKP